LGIFINFCDQAYSCTLTNDISSSYLIVADFWIIIESGVGKEIFVNLLDRWCLVHL